MAAAQEGPPCHAFADSPVGELQLVAHGNRLAGVYFVPCTYPPDPREIGERVEPGSVPVLARAADQLEQYFVGERRTFDVPLAPLPNPFAARVRELLLTIPYGGHSTYGRLAAQLGSPGAAQGVGQAVGHNPVSIIVPCHRVVGADGTLTGFAGGLDRKRFLLTLEEPPADSAGRLF